MTHRIEKLIDLKAPVAKVWAALTDHAQFGQWFRVRLEAPFVVGEMARGQIMHPGYEHVVWQARVEAIEPQRRFAFSWRPYAIDPNVDYSSEAPTLVEFTLEPIPDGGTRLTVVESGFENVPAHRRDEAFRMNESGWAAQMQNIAAHVGG